MNELKPCPFCASTRLGFNRELIGMEQVECDNCGAHGPYSETETYEENIKQASDRWNERRILFNGQISDLLERKE